MQPLPEAGTDAVAARVVHIEVDPAYRFQRMVGFGAALTDASAWLLARQMSPGQRDDLLRELFGREDDGIGLDFTRLTIGASDFSRHHYRSEEHTSELQSLMRISYAVFCLKKKKRKNS